MRNRKVTVERQWSSGHIKRLSSGYIGGKTSVFRISLLFFAEDSSGTRAYDVYMLTDDEAIGITTQFSYYIQPLSATENPNNMLLLSNGRYIIPSIQFVNKTDASWYPGLPDTGGGVTFSFLINNLFDDLAAYSSMLHTTSADGKELSVVVYDGIVNLGRFTYPTKKWEGAFDNTNYSYYDGEWLLFNGGSFPGGYDISRKAIGGDWEILPSVSERWWE